MVFMLTDVQSSVNYCYEICFETYLFLLPTVHHHRVVIKLAGRVASIARCHFVVHQLCIVKLRIYILKHVRVKVSEQ